MDIYLPSETKPWLEYRLLDKIPPNPSYIRSQKLKIILYLTVFYSDKLLILCELSLD